MRLTSYTKGIVAEYFAAALLRLKGYKILEHRYKTPWGEIDLIAKRRNLLVLVEVKRRKTLKIGLEAILPKQRSRIEKASQVYIGSAKIKFDQVRFDVIVTTPTRLHHLKDAWQTT